MSEKLVLQGKYVNGLFECKTIQTKCPSKYKDDIRNAEKNIKNTTTLSSPAEKSSDNYN